MIVHPDFLDHWKTKTLIELTGTETAPLMVLRLWAHCQRQKKSVFVTLNLKSICHTTVPTEELKKHLVEAGFLRLGENSEIIVHDWEEVNRVLRASWNNGQKGGAGMHKNEPTGNPRDTHRQPTGNGTRRIDKIRLGNPRVSTRATQDQSAGAVLSEEEKEANRKKFADACRQTADALRSGAEVPDVENL